MSDLLKKYSVTFKNYKCFTEESGFTIKRVNVLIGRNNTGKSSVLDLIEAMTTSNFEFDRSTWHQGQKPEIYVQTVLTENLVNSLFTDKHENDVILGNYRAFGRSLVPKRVKVTVDPPAVAIYDIVGNSESLPAADFVDHLAKELPPSLRRKDFRRISAERDITPENADNGTRFVSPSGSGFTNTIYSLVNIVDLGQRDLVEKTFLQAFNQIFEPDSSFTRILPQLQQSKGAWEVFLEDEHHGRVAVSKSCSGIKTVLLVLANLILVPAINAAPQHKPDLTNYVFAFEELENNMHPALLRRLLQYLDNFIQREQCVLFLTTHSSVMIDFFAKQEDAQIIHVTQTDGKSTCQTVTTYIQNHGILDDLDIRASDLLQTNGIIWVEGPSDRIYLNRWIDLWSNGELREGTHYQCLFYGGRLLAHLSAEPDQKQTAVAILGANRHAIVLIDSDKDTENASLNDTKNRIIAEFARIEALSWVTKGREIENYISASVVQTAFGLPTTPNGIDIYQDFFEDYLEKLKPGDGKKFANQKPMLAEKLVPLMTKENLSAVLDLNERMVEVCERIRTWNK